MGANKVTINTPIGERTLIDLTADTAKPATVFDGETFHAADGEERVGTFTLKAEFAEQAELIERIVAALSGKMAGGGVKIDGLPAGYVRAGYIQFNAGDIVDTGIFGTRSTKIKCVFTWDSGDATTIYGCASTNNTASLTAYVTSGSGNWRFGSKTLVRSTKQGSEFIHVSIQSVSGVETESGAGTYSGVTEFTTPGTITIGTARNASGTLPRSLFNGKLFLFELWQGDSKVLKLIPVVSLSGEYRLWDIVAQTFVEKTSGEPFVGGEL